MEELDKRLKRIEEMFSISRKNQPIKIGQMNANNERIDKIEERIVRIEESIVKIQQKSETSNIPEARLRTVLEISDKSQDTIHQLESKHHINENENVERQDVNNLITDFEN